MSTILAIQDISVNYGNIKALKGISLTIEEGEIVCLIGANGAGKSTLLKAIMGLEPLVAGTICFNNAIIGKSETAPGKNGQVPEKKRWLNKLMQPPISTDRIAADGIALVPEGRGVFAQMSVLENLEMGAYLKRDKTYFRNKLSEVYALFPILNARKSQKAGSLSGGEQQMLAIGRALMGSPRLLLLDEPGLGLAPLIIRDIFEAILKINKEEGVTIFLVEQNAKLALNNSRRGYVMETGCIVMENDSQILLTDSRVKAAYLGE